MTVRDSAARKNVEGCAVTRKNGNSLLINPGPTRPQGGIPMDAIVPQLPWSVKEKMRKRFNDKDEGRQGIRKKPSESGWSLAYPSFGVRIWRKPSNIPLRF